MENRIFAPEMIVGFVPELLAYLDVTVAVALGSILAGSLWGMVLAALRLSNKRLLKAFSAAYVYIMRCTPSIVLLFLVFYGLPVLAREFNVRLEDVSRAYFAIIAFSLIFGAYISEVFRAAYLSVPRGQYEAAVSIGLSPWQAFYQIMLPQSALVALPNFGNSTVNLLKEGALASTIGLIDLLGKGNLIIAQHYGAYALEIYLACLFIYWGVTSVVSKLCLKLEARLSVWRAAGRKRDSYNWHKIVPGWLKRKEKGGAANGSGYGLHV